MAAWQLIQERSSQTVRVHNAWDIADHPGIRVSRETTETFGSFEVGSGGTMTVANQSVAEWFSTGSGAGSASASGVPWQFRGENSQSSTVISSGDLLTTIDATAQSVQFQTAGDLFSLSYSADRTESLTQTQMPVGEGDAKLGMQTSVRESSLTERISMATLGMNLDITRSESRVDTVLNSLGGGIGEVPELELPPLAGCSTGSLSLSETRVDLSLNPPTAFSEQQLLVADGLEISHRSLQQSISLGLGVSV